MRLRILTVMAALLLVATLPAEAKVTRVFTPEFSVEIDDRFETKRVYGLSVSAREAPETLTSPMLSVWADEMPSGSSVADLLDEIVRDESPLVERRAVEHAGLKGEFVKFEGRLVDAGEKVDVPWFRLRVMLATADGKGRYQATAMVSGEDLSVIEPMFARMLDSIEIRLTGEDADQARSESAAAFDAAIAAAREKAEKNAAELQRRDDAAQAAARNALAAAELEDAEVRFDKALAEAGLGDRKAALRKIASPSLTLFEIGADDQGATGLTRVGGGPDLAEGTPWPRNATGYHYNFLAQIDLAKLPARYQALPESGLLSFFSGADLKDWKVLFSPAGARLVHHALPEDAEAIAETAAAMLTWDKGEASIGTAQKDGLVAEAEADGRVRFLRDGEPVIALSSEYEVSLTPQILRSEPSLTVPHESPAYAAVGIDDPYPLWQAVGEAMTIGDGPQHQMFGVAGIEQEGEWSPVGRAMAYAESQGWDDLSNPEDWFILFAVRSGGEANFSFWDHGNFIYLGNVKDIAKGDFSRVFAFVDSS